MARDLGIKRCWFHRDHYDVPKRRVEEIRGRAILVTARRVLEIARGVKKRKKKAETEVLFTSKRSHQGRPYAIDWYWEPPRRRTVLLSGKTRFDSREWPGMVFGVVRREKSRFPAMLLVASSPTPPTDSQSRVFETDEGSWVCLGDRAAKRVARGILDPREAFWNTAFAGKESVEGLRPGVFSSTINVMLDYAFDNDICLSA